MGAKTWMLVSSDGHAKETLRNSPVLDPDATTALVQSLFPSELLTPVGEGNLAYTCPPDSEVVAGCFPGTSVVAAKEFAPDYPSRLAPDFITALGGELTVLHAMHSVVDWFAFAVWRRGVLARSLSLSPDSGVVEDIGEKLEFELPFWAGKYPAVEPNEDYPFPFHPLEMGEAALENFFGYQIEGFLDTSHPDPESVPLLRFLRKRRPWWKLW